MKCFILLAVLSYFALAQGMSDEVKAIIRENALECIKESSVDEDILKKSKDGHFEDDAKFKEFMFCMMKKPEFMTPEGELQPTEIKEKISAEFGDEIAEKVVKECGSKHESTPQETAFAFGKCFHEIVPHEDDE